MNFTETKTEKLLREYTITVPSTEYEVRLNQRLMEVGKTAKVPGFRPGKIPLLILRQRYEENVKAQVVENVVQHALETLYKDKDVKPALKPNVDFKSFDPEKSIEFTVSFEVLPQIDAIKLEDIKLERLKADTPKEKFEEAYKNIKGRNRQLVSLETERASQTGDVVMIDFVGTSQGKPIERGSGTNVPLELGSKSFIDTFEDQLTGKNKGDHVQVKVTFPKEYAEASLAGQAAEFEVDILDIKNYQDPELNEEFAKGVGFDTLEALEKAVSDQLNSECERMSFLVIKRNLLDHLAEIKFDIPQGLHDIEFKTIWEHYLNLQKQEADKESVKTESDLEKDKTQYQDIAARRVRLGLILADIGRRHEVSVTQRELDQALITTVRRYPGQEKQVYEYFKSNSEALATLRAPIFEDKVVKLIVEKANVTDKAISYEQLEKAVKEITEGDDE